MRSAIRLAALAFIVVFLGLRLAEYLYHRVRHTLDWSPHWGSWVFAVLVGLYVFASNVGR